MQKKGVKMLKRKVDIGLIVCFFSLGWGAFAEKPSTHATKYGEVLTAPDKSRNEKWHLVENTEAPLSDVQREALQRIVYEKPEKTSAYFALCTLVKVDDTQSVDLIIEMLKRGLNYGRYYALALGHLGDKKAIPALKEVMSKTKRDYVREDCRFALRLLDASTDETPPAPTEGGPIKIKLSASRNYITPGQSFMLKASIENLREQPVRISSSRSFFKRFVQIYPEDGQYVLPFTKGRLRGRRSKLDDFPKISGGKTKTLKAKCRIEVEKAFSDKWLYDGHRAFVFYPGAGHTHKVFDIGMYKPGKELSLKLVLDYDPGKSVKNNIYADFEAKVPLITERIVSNMVRVEVKSESD